MLTVGHDNETRFLNARKNLVSPAQGFVGQLLKDRSTSRQKPLRDSERGERRFQVDRWSLDSLLGDSLLYDRNSRRLGGPHRRNYSGWPGVALQYTDHHVAPVPAGMPELIHVAAYLKTKKSRPLRG